MKTFLKTPASGVALALLAIVWLACGTTRQVVTDGTSKTVVTVDRPIKFKVRGPITFPKDFPVVGGRSVAAGTEIDIQLNAGESVTLDDKVSTDGKVEITGVAKDGMAARLDAPEGSYLYTAQAQPGSTYTWRVPSLFGDAPAVVAVSGGLTVLLAPDAFEEGKGTRLREGGILAFDYQVGGPPAVWQAPFETPHGLIEGEGTIETSDPMVLVSNRDASSVTVELGGARTDADGRVWQHSYVGAYPVQLQIGDGLAAGVTTVDGGADSNEI